MLCILIYLLTNEQLPIKCCLYYVRIWKNSLDGRWNRTNVERAQTRAQPTVPPSNPMMGYFYSFIFFASTETTLLPLCEIKRSRLLLVFNNYQLYFVLLRANAEPILWPCCAHSVLRKYREFLSEPPFKNTKMRRRSTKTR
uniref:Secreted protein n=1 Tax=Meloidogyne hapla TaxID=6305 RepID=A0A1I8BWJ7_MELHA